jgi:hypothetical protein
MGLPGLDAEEDPDSPCLINTVEICAVGCRSLAEGHLKGGVALGCFWRAMGATGRAQHSGKRRRAKHGTPEESPPVGLLDVLPATMKRSWIRRNPPQSSHPCCE